MNAMFLLNQMDYTKPIENFADKLSFGGFMVLLGMGVVFAVLVLLMVLLLIFGRIFNISKKAPTTVSQPKTEVVPVTNTSNNDEIVAVIAAAIAMAESESDGVKFKVVSFRKR